MFQRRCMSACPLAGRRPPKARNALFLVLLHFAGCRSRVQRIGLRPASPAAAKNAAAGDAATRMAAKQHIGKPASSRTLSPGDLTSGQPGICGMELQAVFPSAAPVFATGACPFMGSRYGGCSPAGGSSGLGTCVRAVLRLSAVCVNTRDRLRPR